MHLQASGFSMLCNLYQIVFVPFKVFLIFLSLHISQNSHKLNVSWTKVEETQLPMSLLFFLVHRETAWSVDVFEFSVTRLQFCKLPYFAWIPWKSSFRYMKKRLQAMLWHHKARVNSHQRWKQTRNRICFNLWCELTSTMNTTELCGHS